MHITLQNIGKRYDSGWVFKEINLEIPPGTRLAILGPNGSGKSTLFQILTGYLSPTKGKVHYSRPNGEVKRDEVYQYVSISAAYGELDEELTCVELFEHYKKFREMGISNTEAFLEQAQLDTTRKKQIKNFSSGMKQRLSLALAFNMRSDVLFLDEPTNFLDEEKRSWYLKLLSEQDADRTIVVATNDLNDIYDDFAKFDLGN